jgi:acetyltransferase-like isoleucine patch superfamily enzyme
MAASFNMALEQVEPLPGDAADGEARKQAADRGRRGRRHSPIIAALPRLSPSDLAPNLLLGTDVELAEGVDIGANVVLYDGVRVGPGARIGDGAVLGRVPTVNPGSSTRALKMGPTVVGAGAIVCPQAVVDAGVTLGEDAFVGDHSSLRPGVRIGAESSIGAMCTVNPGAVVGDRVRTQGRCGIAPRIVIEDDVFLGPGVELLSGITMTASSQSGPAILRRCCQLGAGVIVLPGVEVGEEAIVGAGAVVVSDVPPAALVRGVPARQSAG